MVNTCTTTGINAPAVTGTAAAPQALANNAPPAANQPAAIVGVAYTNTVWSGALPAATGFTAKTYAAMPIAQQKKRAEAMHTFLWNPANTLLHLKTNGGKFTALINTPQSNKVKVVHDIGVGASAIGSSAPTDGNLLMLAGEGDQHLGCPD
eukprot:12092005-Ditylum_brightwellii.AAC.1